MPGVFNLSVDEVVREATAAFESGVRGVILFGLPETKDETASGAYADKGIVQQAMRAVARPSRTWSSSRTPAFASTPRTATAASCAGAKS